MRAPLLPVLILAVAVLGCATESRLGVRFGSHGLRLDVHEPHFLAKPARAAVIFLYGGSWQDGSRQDHEYVGRALASRGFVAVVPDYRLYPEVTFPAFVTDAADAIRWTIRNVRGPTGSPSPIVVIGHSAGAHIAMMLTMDERFLTSAERQSLCGAIGLGGPYDFVPIPALLPVFGGADLEQIQPFHHVDGTEPPVLLITGDADRVVSSDNSRRFAEEIERRGGRVELAIFPDRGHSYPLASLAWPRRLGSPVLERIEDFVERVTQGPNAACAAR